MQIKGDDEERVDCDDGIGHVRTDYEGDLNRNRNRMGEFSFLLFTKRWGPLMVVQVGGDRCHIFLSETERGRRINLSG